MKQIDKMRQLYKQLDGDEGRIIAAYAAAERNGEVRRKSNKYGMDADEYAKRLFCNTYKRR